jgi:Flp pilus assembly pilin Flp
MMMKYFRPFRKDEEGAVTVDWVVLTGAIVGLGLGVIGIMRSGPKNVGQHVSTTLANITVDTSNQ